MKKHLLFLVMAMAFTACATLHAQPTLELYVDSAPNCYVPGTGFGAWWDLAKADIVAGTFQNMGSGHYPGQAKANPADMTVYDFGDCGNRLTWIFWLPGTSQSEFVNLDFQIKMYWDQYGIAYTFDWSDPGTPILNTSDAGWSADEFWAEVYAGGVIGFFGDANWGAYGYTEDTPEARAAFQYDLGVYLGAQSYEVGLVGWTASPPQQEGIRVDIAPEPTSLAFLGTALLGLVGRRLCRRKP